MPSPASTVGITLSPAGEINCRVQIGGDNNRGAKPTAPRVSKSKKPAFLSIAGLSEKGETIRTGYGAAPKPISFGSQTKRNIKNAAGALAKTYNKSILFITLTLPGRTQKAVEAQSSWSAAVVERFAKWLDYHVPGCQWLQVWERHADGVLHQHWCVGHKQRSLLQWVVDNLQQYVQEMYQRISRDTGVDWFAREHGGTWQDSPAVLRNEAEFVQKSVTRYLAKYVAKQSKIESQEHAYKNAGPTRWYHSCKALKQAVVNYTLKAGAIIRAPQLALRIWDTAVSVARSAGWTVYTYEVRYARCHKVLLAYPPDTTAQADYNTLVRYLQSVAVYS